MATVASKSAIFGGSNETKSQLATVNRFNDFTDLYDKYRLNYSTNIINLVLRYTNYTKKYTIADIGTGTGILTRQLAKKAI